MKRVALLLLLTCWTVLTWHRAGEWGSNLSLWRSAVKVTPCLPRPHVNLAESLGASDNLQYSLEAQREYTTAMALATEHRCVVLR